MLFRVLIIIVLLFIQIIPFFTTSINSIGDFIRDINSIVETLPIKYIDNCMNITESGYYILTRNITYDADPGECIVIYTSNVVIDGNGYALIYSKPKPRYVPAAVLTRVRNPYEFPPTPYENIVVKNLVIINFMDAITLILNRNIVVSNVTVINTTFGIGVGYENVIVENNRIINYNLRGIDVRGYLFELNNIVVRNNIVVNKTGIIYTIDIYDSGIFIEGLGRNILVYNNTVMYSYIGLAVVGVSNATVFNNTVAEGEWVGSEEYGSYGLALEHVSETLVFNNTVSDTIGGIDIIYTNNTSVFNNTVKTINYGIYLNTSSSNTVFNNTIRNTEYGMYLNNSFRNSFFNNIVVNNKYGVYLEKSRFNIFYNNLFNNTINVDSDKYSLNNDFSTSLYRGRNIVGGEWIGGNAWLEIGKKGFSETCIDMDNNGVCDYSYKFTTSSGLEYIDYYPLKIHREETPGETTTTTETYIGTTTIETSTETIETITSETITSVETVLSTTSKATSTGKQESPLGFTLGLIIAIVFVVIVVLLIHYAYRYLKQQVE